MNFQDEVSHQQELLATYRRTLKQWLVQAAQSGGEKFAPPLVTNGIHEARDNIRRIKTTLRDWGIPVEDLPDDEPIGENDLASNCMRMIVAQDVAGQYPRPTETIQSGTNPFVYGPAVRPEHFHGRASQRANIKCRIGGIAAQCISIIGMRRSGKSSLLLYVRERIAEFCPNDQRPLPVLIDLQNKCFQTPLGLIEGLRRGIEQQTGESPWQRDQNDDPWAVNEGLEKLRDSGHRLIVLIDEFEQIGKRLEQFQDWGDDWRSKASAGLMAMAIASRRPLSEIYKRCGLTSPFDNIFTTTTLGAFKPHVWRELVHSNFERSSRMLSQADLTLVEDLAGGLPFYTQMAAALLWQYGDQARASDAFRQQAEPFFYQLWDYLQSAEQLAVRYAAGVSGVAAPDAQTSRLLRDLGLLRPDGRLFSSAFISYVRAQP